MLDNIITITHQISDNGIQHTRIRVYSCNTISYEWENCQVKNFKGKLNLDFFYNFATISTNYENELFDCQAQMLVSTKLIMKKIEKILYKPWFSTFAFIFYHWIILIILNHI